jgi:hypothetical protein
MNLEDISLKAIDSIICSTVGQDMTMSLIDEYLTSSQDDNAIALRNTNIQMLVNYWKNEEINALKVIKNIQSVIEDPSRLKFI